MKESHDGERFRVTESEESRKVDDDAMPDRETDGAAGARRRAGDARPSRAAGAVARIAFALVFVVNVQCAVSFVLFPSGYAPQFELDGVSGAVAVQGLGVAFLMWNATYPAVIANPRRFRALGAVVLAQQAIGLAGESWIRAALPAGHELLSASIERFIAFDAFGLLVMTAAFAWLALTDRRDARSFAP